MGSELYNSLKDSIFSKTEVGIGTPIGSVVVNYLEILNPVLSTVTLSIGIGVGMLTLLIRWREYNAS